MIKSHQTKANLGVGFGIVCWLLAAMINSAVTMDNVRVDAGGGRVTQPSLLLIPALMLFLLGATLYLWGCVNYALGKGYSGWWGMLGLGSVFGLLILVLMRDRRKDGIDPDAPSFERTPINPPPTAYPPPPGATNGSGPSPEP